MVGVGVVVAAVLLVVFLRQRGVGQRAHVEISALGAKASVKTSVDAEVQGIKAGRDVRVHGGASDPARLKDVEAGRDVIRDTTGRDPKS